MIKPVDIKIVGSPKQVIYANNIIYRIRTEFPKAKLPIVHNARFWIENQNEHPNRLLELSKEIQTAFTDTYPKFHQDMAIDALHQIMKHLDDVVIIDSETTGIKKSDVFVEIGIVKFKYRKPTIVFESLVRPENMDLSKYGKSKASQVNSITAEMLQDAPTLPQVWKLIEPYLHNHIICFNSYFDINMVIRSAKHYPELVIPDMRSTDLMRLAQCYYELPDVPSLDELAKALHIRIPKNERHRAAFDALITGRALLKLYGLSKRNGR